MEFSTRRILRVPVRTAVAIALLTGPAFAGGLREVDQTIFGMDCAPCAYGIEQGLLKLPGVTAVRVSLNEGKAILSLSPDSRATLAQIRRVIRNNGFTPKEAQVLVMGHLGQDGGRWWIDTGPDGRWQLEAFERVLPGPRPVGAPENVTLRVRVPETLSSPPTVRVIEHVQ